MTKKQHNLSFQYTQFDSLEGLDELGKSLISAARAALTGSYSPYSRFRVAAALKLSNGEVVTGTNQENSAYPSGLCAERVAIFAAKSCYPDADILGLAITASSEVIDATHPVTPCGACRQVLLEYELNQSEPYKVWLTGTGSAVIELSDAKSLLPLHFFGDGLKKG